MTLTRMLPLIAASFLAGQPCLAQSDAPASSSGKQYHVEVIAFQYRGPDTSGGEAPDRLIVEDYFPEAGFDIDAYNRVQEVVSYTGLKQLGGALERLRNSPQYSILAAPAWVQPLLSQSRAVDVPLGGESPATSGLLQDSSELTGTLRVFGDHLLFVDLQLRARLPRRPGTGNAAAQSAGAGESASGRTRLEDGYQSFRISERRRIKLDEIHYFDHPHIGVVVSVTRHEGAG